MFNHIEVKKITTSEELIGEVYCKTYFGIGYTYYSVCKPGELGEFVKFTSAEISDQVAGFIKIKNTWFPRKDVFFYDDVYKKLREQILDDHGADSTQLGGK